MIAWVEKYYEKDVKKNMYVTAPRGVLLQQWRIEAIRICACIYGRLLQESQSPASAVCEPVCEDKPRTAARAAAPLPMWLVLQCTRHCTIPLSIARCFSGTTYRISCH